MIYRLNLINLNNHYFINKYINSLVQMIFWLNLINLENQKPADRLA